jgi:hypothetical protein
VSRFLLARASSLSAFLKVGRTGHGDAGQVALHVGHEHRHAGAENCSAMPCKRHGLAGAGRARDQAVAVGAVPRPADENTVTHGPAPT